MLLVDTKLSENSQIFHYRDTDIDNTSTSYTQEPFHICNAYDSHLEGVKILADANRHIFGFITRNAFYDALQLGALIVAAREDKVVGFLRYYHRKRDLQTTLYDICVDESERGKNLGQGMLKMLIDCCRSSHRAMIQLKCPAHLAANTFYEKSGFHCIDTVMGKRQKLNIWRLDLADRSHQ
jgi:GNAT superfamily N-acetyltransferase